MSKLRGGAKVTKPLFKFDFKCLVANSKCLNKTQRITLTLGGGKNSSFFLFVPLFSCGLGTFCFQLLLQSLFVLHFGIGLFLLPFSLSTIL